MDGRKKLMPRSLEARLSIGISACIFLMALIAGAFAFLTAFSEAHELQDDVLRQVATVFERHHLTLPEEGEGGTNADSDADARVYVQWLPPHGVGVAPRVGAAPSLRDGLIEGIQTAVADDGDKTYRVLVRTTATGRRLAVSQETSFRDEIARHTALHTIMPFLLLIPVLFFVLRTLVRKLFRPVAILARDIDRRTGDSLHAITNVNLPTEIKPFVAAINRLLYRVALSVGEQRRFVANAAHELRSPLTAMSLQAERLAQAEMSVPARERLQTLQLGLARSKTLLDQLLEFARAQALSERPGKSASVTAVFQRTLEDLMPMAEAKQIDLGVRGSIEANIAADQNDVIQIIKNVVDNAIRYSPTGGRIDLSIEVQPDRVTLCVTDAGPGIAPDERTRVFEPFYRILGSDATGSGLGLSIVQTLAQRNGATVSLDYADAISRSGLQVIISFYSKAPG